MLVNGDFEGAAGPPPAGWTQVNSVATRVAGTRTGGSGSFVGQIGYDGSHALGRMYQMVAISGAGYVWDAWGQGDGVANPVLLNAGGGTLWTGTTGAWQHVVQAFTADGLGPYLAGKNLAAGNVVQWDDAQLVPQLNVTRNQGLLQGTVQCGDGLTPATLPTMIGGGRRGIKTAAADHVYLYHATMPTLGAAGTIFQTWNLSPATLAEGAGTHVLASQGDNGSYQNGWLISQNQSNLVVYWGGAGAIITTAITPGLHSIAVVNNGTVVTAYMDGRVIGTPAAPSGVATQTGLYVAGTPAAFLTPHTSSLFDVKVHPYALTPTQIRSLHERSLSLLNYY